MFYTDPFPEQVVLTADEVRRMLGFKTTAWREFLANNPEFPKTIIVGKTKTGREIRKYLKAKVLLFLESRSG